MIDIIYFYIEYRYLDSNRAVFNEVSAILDIAKFAGIKRIVTLAVFSLTYYPYRNKVKANLVERSRQFVFLLGIDYFQYYGNVIFIEKIKPLKFLLKIEL